MRFVLLFLTALTLSACSYIPTYFRVPILQGNVVTTKKVKQLEIGMTPPQVRYLLGTPLVTDTFDHNRWDYVFFYRDPRGVEREDKLSLYFKGGKLARVEGDKSFTSVVPEKTEKLDPDAKPLKSKT